jgi:hypothetical protein
MRRTRDNWLVTPPPRQKEISGLRIFNGEDLHFHERRRSMMEVQKKWLDQQMKEINEQKLKQEQEKKLFEYQSFTLNQARARAMDQAENKKRKVYRSARDFNKRLAEESRERKKSEKMQKILYETADLKYLEDARKVGAFINPLMDHYFN